MPNRMKSAAIALLAALSATTIADMTQAGGREEGHLLEATAVLQEVKAMPDMRLPDTLLAHAYGIAVIPNVTQVAFIFGGRHGNGVLTIRDKLTAPWSNPVFISLTGGSWGFQAGAESSDIILVFTTKSGVEGIAGGKLTLGADASVAAGPVGRQGSAGTDITFNTEVYSYARSRGLFGGVALDGSVISIDKSANGAMYNKPGVTASEIFSGQAPAPPEAAQRFLDQLAQTTGTAARTSPAPQADSPAAAPTAQAPATAQPARTYPLEDQKK
jgi:lipid-binding SYLF domain-containing protein